MSIPLQASIFWVFRNSKQGMWLPELSKKLIIRRYALVYTNIATKYPFSSKVNIRFILLLLDLSSSNTIPQILYSLYCTDDVSEWVFCKMSAISEGFVFISLFRARWGNHWKQWRCLRTTLCKSSRKLVYYINEDFLDSWKFWKFAHYINGVL